jgi:hypothetical protein
MTAGGWAEPDMVIRYSKAYENALLSDIEKALRIIQVNAELIKTILSAIPASK